MNLPNEKPGLAHHSKHPAETGNLRPKGYASRVTFATVNYGQHVAEILPRVLACIEAQVRRNGGRP